VVVLGDHDTARHRGSFPTKRRGTDMLWPRSSRSRRGGGLERRSDAGRWRGRAGCAIAERIHIWAPFPGPDLGREQHWRTGGVTEAHLRTESPSPMLPPPTAPWPQRQPMLKRYVRWLVHGCGVTQAATARVLNATGQRTPIGRPW
jgi:hypothetical protein